MRNMICFDMDGTIADLYGVDNWLDHLLHENTYPYSHARPMWNMEKLNEVLMLLSKEGWEIRIISWLAKDSTPEYKHAVARAKKEWLDKFDFPASHFHFVRYGATKADSVRAACSGGRAILIDDNEKVRKGWHLGETIDPTVVEDLAEFLAQYLEEKEV